MSICRWLALSPPSPPLQPPAGSCAFCFGTENPAGQVLSVCSGPAPPKGARIWAAPAGVEGACACESSQPRPIRPHHLPPSAQPGPPGLRGRAGSEKQPSWGSNGPPYPGVVQLPGACGIAVRRRGDAKFQ